MAPYLYSFAALLVALLLYFRLARRFGIVDRPNARSSHQEPTIRGGGIVFVLALLIFEAWSGFRYPWFFAGTLLVAAVSFVDDMVSLPSKLRLGVQLVGALLLLADTAAFAQPIAWVLLLALFVTGAANVFNFMDGVNGITGLYGLVALVTLAYLNQQLAFADMRLIALAAISVVVFGIFNFRSRAVCFAGDVGSISLAFIVLFLLVRLILATGNPYFVLLLAVYGVDSSLTILRRLANRENIMEPHRTHLYQWLVKPGPLTHLQVAGLYAALQLGVNALVVATWQGGAPQLLGWAVALLALLTASHVLVGRSLGRRYQLS